MSFRKERERAGMTQKELATVIGFEPLVLIRFSFLLIAGQFLG